MGFAIRALYCGDGGRRLRSKSDCAGTGGRQHGARISRIDRTEARGLTEVDPVLATLITGSSSGLGRASALRLARERTLILHGRNLDRLEETRRQCHAPERHILWPFDLKNIDSLSDALARLLMEKTLSVEA